MTEDDARDWVRERFGTAALDRLGRFVAALINESEQQNLISASSLPSIWVRHIADSAQLTMYAPVDCRSWIDVGSGAGFPGLVVAILMPCEVFLVEPRRKRANFLADVAQQLGVTNATVVPSKIEIAKVPAASAVSARAVATIDHLLRATAHLIDHRSRYILPRGGGCAAEVEEIRKQWHGVFHVEQSLTDPQSGILIAERVRRR